MEKKIRDHLKILSQDSLNLLGMGYIIIYPEVGRWSEYNVYCMFVVVTTFAMYLL